MSLTNPKNVITEERLADFYQTILPYLGGMPDILANKFNKSDLYSTDEKIVGRWIDGKPLYQKTINFGGVPSNTSKAVPHNISNFGIAVNIFGTMYASSGVCETLPSGENTNFRVQANTTNAVIITSGGWTGWNCNITIQYTKTTDSSVEIGNDTDYSTTEKIVGTWIDGKPIYKYTYEMVSDTTIGYNNWNTNFTAPSSIDTIIKGELIRKTTTSGESICYPICCDVLPTARTSVKLQVNTSSDVACKSGSLITIWYTKTTD